MSTLIIDINNRCGIGRTKCRCKGSKRFVAASTGKVGSAKFTYCTHSTQSKGPNISKVLWNRIELQRTNGNPYAFQDVNSVTVFYYSERDIPGHLRKPLLIRVKRPYIDVRWYENVDSYANKRWKRIDESDEYPRGDNYTKDGLKLIKKLEELACKLFLSHGVRIESNDNYKIECPICSDGKTVQIRLEDYLNVPGYKKYTHDKNVISERSILIYNGRKLTFPKKSRVDTTYYLPITVDPDNGKGISVYYWNKDDGRTNPLLIEFETPSGYSRWIENISSNGKHERWRALSWKEEKPPGLKTRLDLLSCIYNKTVQINVGKFEGCHKNHHPLHKNRFNYSYKNVPETYPPIYVHTYESTNGPFVISGVTFNSQSQNFQVNPLLFNGVIRFMAYVSPCDKENPFLICVESTGAGSHSEYNWYERKDNNGNWKKHSFPGRSQLSLEEAGTEAEGFFETVQSTLKLNECYVSTPDNGIQLDVRLTLNDGQHLLQYTDTSTTNMTVPIFITKSREDLVPGFFKNSHKPATKDRRKFSVSKYLKSEGEIGGVRRAVSGVENVYVYFWEGNTIRPIIIKIQVSGEDTPRYYSKGNGSRDSWMYDMNRKKNIINLLDHWNCENNNAIPIELTMPTDTERFRSSVSPSKYLTNGLVTSSGSSYIPRGSNGIYKVEGYQINGDKKISRVTYNNKSTNIIPPYGYEGPTLNIYYWKDDGNNVPLLVEFKPKDVKKPSIWYENLGKDNTKWKPVSPTEAEKFYIDKDRKKELTDVFTKRLHEVNCTVNQIVQLDISQPPGRYCHSLSSLHNRRLKVSESRIKIPKYTLHEHTSAINGRDTFAISSIINKGVEQTGEFKFPLKDVKKVTVYFPNCNITMPILMRIEQEKNHGGYRWLKRTSATVWKEVSEYFEKVKDEPEKIRSLLDDIKNATLVCNNSPEVDPPSQGQSTLVDDDEVETWTTMFQGAVKEDKEESEEFFVQDEDEDEEIKEKMDKSTFTNDSSGPTAYSSNNLPGVGSPVTLSVSYSKPGVIIDIKGGNEELAETNYRIGTGGFVELDKKEDPKGFYRYTHTSCDEPPFKVEEVRHGANDIEDHKVDLGINHDESIEYLSVWYWKNDCIMKNPLFIEVLDGNGNYHYHFNKGDDIQWSPYKELDKLFTDEELERVLNRLNCQHNSVVQIDVTRVSGEYCHDSIDPQLPHKNSKIKVTKVDDRKLGNYTAYEHVPNPSGKFNISSLKRGDTPIIFSGLQLFPLKGAQKVVVYFCRSEVNTDSLNGKDKWFKKSNGTIFDAVNDYTLVEGNHSKIIEILDGLQSPCKPPAVTIDLYERFIIGFFKDYYGGNSNLINVQSGPTSDTISFTEYTHKVQSRNSFTVNGFKYNGGEAKTFFTPTKYVTSVSVFYWSALEIFSKTTSRPLLVKVTQQKPTGIGENIAYYENTGEKGNLNWQYATGDLPNQLEVKLKLLNCRLNHAVVVDINQHGIPESYDACDNNDKTHLDKPHGKRIQITKNRSASLQKYTVYTHTLNSNEKFHIVNFINGTHPRETLSGISATTERPILNVEEVKVYFCKQEPTKPLLVYYKKNIWEGTCEYHWYKNKDTDTSKVCEWENEISELSNIDDTTQHEKILKVLDKFDTECRFIASSSTKVDGSTSTPAADTSRTITYTPSTPKSSPETTTPIITAPEAAPLTEPRESQNSPWDLTTILGVLTGVGLVSGSLTGLGWWAFKRSKGDPWVRQI